MKRNRILAGMAAVATSAAVVVAGPAATAAPTVSDPVAEGFVGPLQIAFDSQGRPLVTNGFLGDPGMVSMVKRNGDVVPAVTDEGAISGVAVSGKLIAYTLSGGGLVEIADLAALRGAAPGPYQLLKVQKPNGDQRVVANLGRLEQRHNPDSHQIYGWIGLDDACAPENRPAGNHKPRPGVVESNPHAVAPAPGGGWYVVDAAANAIYKVKRGKVSLVSVLKPQQVEITPEIAAENGLDACTIGTKYNFEPVPTDIQVGSGGSLFVSLLPGEGNDSGAPFVPGMGKVVRVNPVNGRAATVVSGFTGATNLALGNKMVWVSELFAGRVTQVNLRSGKVRRVSVGTPTAVERYKGNLFVTHDIEGENGAKLSIIDF